MVKNIDVCIILVNYNGYEDTDECLKSISINKHINHKIIIADNSNTKNINYIKKFQTIYDADVLEIDNHGFSDGNNRAVYYCVNKYGPTHILLLNNDTTVDAQFLNVLLTEANAHPSYGIISGKIYSYYDRDYIWAAGGEYDRSNGRTIQYSGIELHQYDKPRECTFTSGCMMLIRSSVYVELGGLSEKFFMYGEDTEYCQRVLDQGYKIYYNPQAIIYHKISASQKKDSLSQQYYMIRNNLYVISQYHDCKTYFIRTFYSYLKDILKKRRNFRAVVRAYHDYFKKIDGRVDL